jgi:hypothetical protein
MGTRENFFTTVALSDVLHFNKKDYYLLVRERDDHLIYPLAFVKKRRVSEFLIKNAKWVYFRDTDFLYTLDSKEGELKFEVAFWYDDPEEGVSDAEESECPNGVTLSIYQRKLGIHLHYRLIEFNPEYG